MMNESSSVQVRTYAFSQHKPVIVLTHASDMSISKPPVQVMLGAVNLNEPGFLAQKYHVKKLIQHPEYSTARVYHDIALIELDRTVKFSENIQPACLNTKSEIPEFGLEVTGWGKTSRSRKFMSA
jgi:secreted trypsin-like serine protease